MLEYLDDMESPEELRALTAWKVHTLTGDRKRDVEPERYPKSTSDVLYRYCRTRNLRREFRGLPRTQQTRAAMPIKNAPHPGEFIRTGIIEPAGLSVTAAAAALHVSRPVLSSLLNGKAGLSR